MAKSAKGHSIHPLLLWLDKQEGGIKWEVTLMNLWQCQWDQQNKKVGMMQGIMTSGGKDARRQSN